MSKIEIKTLALKFAQIVAFIAGVFLTTFNLFSFKIAKNGYYFNDDNQLWLAFGISLLTIAYVIKNWEKI